jgi:hypothetical protein
MTTIPLLDERREFYLRQFREHQPGYFGGCPLCPGVKGRCAPRREAADALDELDVDLSQPSSPHSEAMKLYYIEEYRAHRDCGPDLDCGHIARQHLLACGIDPAEVA